MAEYEQAVFISYAWGEEREAIVNELDETLQQRGIRIIRDKRALGYKGSIKDFMERIGRGSCIIVVISDKYLRSPNCMFELVEIAENRQFHDRVFPIVLSDANIYDPLKRIEYVKFWEGKRKELAKAMKTLDPANLHGIREEMDQYDRIRDKISGITSILKDMNTLTPDMHRDSEFSNLYDAIVERLREGAGDSTAEQDLLAAQKAEEERLARAEADRLAAQKVEEQYKAKEKVVPVETKAAPVAVAPVQKKPASKGKVFGIAAVVVLIICIAGGGFLFSSGALNFLSQGNNTNLPVSTPTTQAATELPVTLLGGGTGKIAFASWINGSGFEIYIMNADGSGVTRLTNNAGSDGGPVWSPDGRQIAFEYHRNSNDEIHVMNADGSNQINLTNGTYDISPAWSPDGAKIAFASASAGDNDFEIYIMNADGSGVTRLTNNAEYDDEPAWSPDGKHIAFVSQLDGFWMQIYIMNADGSGVTLLTNTAAWHRNPVWSPDGKYIAFASNRDDPDPANCDPCNFEIYIMNADGSGVTRLTNTAAPDYGPVWSPDGKYIALETNDDADPANCDPCNYEIYIMNADGSGVTRLTNDPTYDSSPAWQP